MDIPEELIDLQRVRTTGGEERTTHVLSAETRRRAEHPDGVVARRT
ncbi:hypothetical protein [Kitasatospora fiedleri]|nr:hypothetical protein [Kitasatospora fiedleri]